MMMAKYPTNRRRVISLPLLRVHMYMYMRGFALMYIYTYICIPPSCGSQYWSWLVQLLLQWNKWKDDGYVLCSIDVGDAFLMVPQQELTQVSCTDASGATMEFVLGRVLPGQRNGSQMWHEAFSSFLRDELKITPCDAYPCLLRADNSECVLLLHVDDVLCLVEEDYLNKTLLPALRAEYQIFLDVVAREGDELTSLKRKHVMLGPNQLAI